MTFCKEHAVGFVEQDVQWCAECSAYVLPVEPPEAATPPGRAAQKLSECRMAVDKAIIKRKRLFVSEETLKRRDPKVPAHLLAWAVRRIEVLEEKLAELEERAAY